MLARNRDLPLYVDVYYYIEDEPQNIDTSRLESEDESLWPRPLLKEKYINFFRSLAPHFRRLRLRESRIDWSDPWISSLANLTTLELNNADADARPSWTEFISLLRSSPTLKRLILCSAGPWDDEPNASYSDIPLPLPNLTELVLAAYETQECMTALLQRLYLPALKSLSLDPFFSSIPSRSSSSSLARPLSQL